MNTYNLIKNDLSHTIRSDNHIIQDIFSDWWDIFLNKNTSLNIRDIVKYEVLKFLCCGKKENGYAFYSCSNCDNYAFVPFTCKSRFCPSCGINSCIKRSNFLPSKVFEVPHRHIVFTISDLLWDFFRIDRSLLNLLFEAVSFTILSWFKSISKVEAFTPGIIATLHTFGRNLKWNTHIHVLVTEGAIGRLTSWKEFDFFPYSLLRKRFMYRLLSNLSKHITSDKFKKVKHIIYKKYYNGFYVYAPKKQISNISSCLKYITRYTSRPVMAESRILEYDGEYVTYFYDRHEDDARITEKIHVFDFIKRLIIHIPEKHFNMVRYYGIYAMPKSKTEHLKTLKQHTSKSFKWASKLLFYFNLSSIKM